MIKILFLQSFYGLGDDQTEYQICDRYSFYRFFGLAPKGQVPDAKMIWLFRESLKKADLIDELFAELDGQIWAADYRSRKGQSIDASLLPQHIYTKVQSGKPLLKAQHRANKTKRDQVFGFVSSMCSLHINRWQVILCAPSVTPEPD